MWDQMGGGFIKIRGIGLEEGLLNNVESDGRRVY